jgi:hypothetical protein
MTQKFWDKLGKDIKQGAKKAFSVAKTTTKNTVKLAEEEITEVQKKTKKNKEYKKLKTKVLDLLTVTDYKALVKFYRFEPPKPEKENFFTGEKKKIRKSEKTLYRELLSEKLLLDQLLDYAHIKNKKIDKIIEAKRKVDRDYVVR